VIRTLVVDDESLARERLRSFLRRFEDVEVVGEAKNGVDAVRLIQEKAPDLVFLDVQMPGLDGFGVLGALERRPQVVFATAYDEYAIAAFEVHAADYLLKPIVRERLEEALRRVRLRLAGQSPAPQLDEIIKLLEARRSYMNQLPVHRGRNIIVLPVAQILWFEVEYRLVFAHVDGDRYMTNFTLKQLEERLDPEIFFRAHKSRLVNLQQIRAIAPSVSGRFKLKMRDQKGSEIELSRAQARELRERMHW
jgi:DNA-binding LytR/AlgR family response regulator